ncbi:type II secretion system ATPase GspE [Ketobacter nezhaii]|uniref:type II secretion system ATPase GspE n=1 Tax=Ketobacter sp. MCCC 1A13808 TaxID=2602738 RepID=UPI0026CE7A72|nr:type II secretion system ATPase GspE [Ketobacter sp. MCCC 1A13808]
MAEPLPMTDEQAGEAISRRRLPFTFAKRYGVVIEQIGEVDAMVAFKAGITPTTIVEIRRFLGMPIQFNEVNDAEFERRLSKAYENNSSEAMQMVEGLGDEMDLASLADSLPETEDLMEQEDDAPIIRLINALLTEAVKVNASDIHIETFEKRLVVRFRVDGVLREIVQPKRQLAPLLVSRIKVMAKLDIAEKRVPQDGRISLRVGGREIDVRVSTMPSNAGERVVLRLLDKQAGRLDLTHLGMAGDDLKRMTSIITKPHGIILVTGPTGSGKTTTLYAGLTQLNDSSRNILTVEDPIEYQLEGIGQTQVNTKVEMTFARGLRAMLRQDPDVVMVGEIRDLVTAEIAVQASLTGHLVLSTLHTNTAIGAVTRLQDMGIEPFLISSALLGVLAQRLVRVLCPECKEAYTADEGECELFGLDKNNPPRIFRATGCDHCNQNGYVGRTGIYELIIIDEELRTQIHNNASEQQMTATARKSGTDIRADGLRKILEGSTTIDEVLRVTREG